MWQGLAGYFALVALRVLLNYRSLRSYLKLPLIERPAAAGDLPSVSIVVPARNEEANLPILLGSLSRLDYAGSLETIVVDDGSSDWTAGIGSEHGATVIRLEGPEPGWTGKNFACWTGAREAVGHWLLFTDADTIHEPGSLDKAMHFALERRLEAVLVFLQQRCLTFWERVLLPFAWQQWFMGVHHDRVNRAGDPEAIANGQYMLIEREAYFRAGGHQAVKDAVADGLALAGALKKAGVALAVARGERLASGRIDDVRASLARNVRAFMGPSGVLGAVLSVLAVPCLVFGIASANPAFILAAVVTWLTATFELMMWQLLFQVGISYAFYQPLAAVVFVWIALDGAARRKRRWKGRLV